MPVIVYSLSGAAILAIPGAALGLYIGSQSGSLIHISFGPQAPRIHHTGE
jgi:hypothetical protein